MADAKIMVDSAVIGAIYRTAAEAAAILRLIDIEQDPPSLPAALNGIERLIGLVTTGLDDLG